MSVLRLANLDFGGVSNLVAPVKTLTVKYVLLSLIGFMKMKYTQHQGALSQSKYPMIPSGGVDSMDRCFSQRAAVRGKVPGGTAS